MNILVIGGTRYFGVPMVNRLLEQGHRVTIASRGNTRDNFMDSVSRIIFSRTDKSSIIKAFSNTKYDLVIDKIAYCSEDVRDLLDVVDCNRYIMMSTTAVYNGKLNITEKDFDPLNKRLVWCSRTDFGYDEIKRQAECALFQKYKHIPSLAVRYPYVIGKDDYTGRLRFYVDRTIKEVPMYIDDLDSQMSFIRSDEAGYFLAWLAEHDISGAINGASRGSISIREILNYVCEKTGKRAIISKSGEIAPYNGNVDYTINTGLAETIGYEFSELHSWIYDLIDYFIECSI